MTDVTNSKTSDQEADNPSLPESQSDCKNPVEQALWVALRRARLERDEARQELCQMIAARNYDEDDAAIFPIQVARERGWDCYADDSVGLEGNIE